MIMKTLLCFLMLFMIYGCAISARFTTAHDLRQEMRGDATLGILEIQAQSHEYKWFSCSYIHMSHVFTGKPFNNKDEDTFDAVGCSARWQLTQ